MVVSDEFLDKKVSKPLPPPLPPMPQIFIAFLSFRFFYFLRTMYTHLRFCVLVATRLYSIG